MEIMSETDQLVAVVLICAAFLWFVFSSHSQSSPTLPGPSFTSQFDSNTEMGQLMRNPYSLTTVLHRLSAKHGQVFSLWLGPTKTIVSSHPEDLAQIYVNTKLFPRHPSFTEALRIFSPRGINNMPVGQRERARKVIHQNFNRSVLDSFHDSIAEALGDMCDSLADKAGTPGRMVHEVNISEEISLAMFQILIKVLCGKDMTVDERKRFSQNVDSLFEGILFELMQYPYRQFLVPFGIRGDMESALREVRSIMDGVLRKRVIETSKQRDSRPNDLLDAVLKVGNGDIDVAMSVLLEFTFAGAHTSSQVLVWSMFELCLNKNVAERMQNEIDNVLGNRDWNQGVTMEDLKKMPYVMGVWKETLRMHPANGGTIRIASRDIVLPGTGTLVSKGARVIGFNGASQLDDSIWNWPEKFRPERWIRSKTPAEGDLVPPGTYAPFGIGSVSCLGRFLADYEGPMALVQLFRRFHFKLACRKEEVVTYSFFVDSARVVTEKGLQLSRGLPVYVERRSTL